VLYPTELRGLLTPHTDVVADAGSYINRRGTTDRLIGNVTAMRPACVARLPLAIGNFFPLKGALSY
jgi:hypothetical protein